MIPQLLCYNWRIEILSYSVILSYSELVKEQEINNN